MHDPSCHVEPTLADAIDSLLMNNTTEPSTNHSQHENTTTQASNTDHQPNESKRCKDWVDNSLDFNEYTREIANYYSPRHHRTVHVTAWASGAVLNHKVLGHHYYEKLLLPVITFVDAILLENTDNDTYFTHDSDIAFAISQTFQAHQLRGHQSFNSNLSDSVFRQALAYHSKAFCDGEFAAEELTNITNNICDTLTKTPHEPQYLDILIYNTTRQLDSRLDDRHISAFVEHQQQLSPTAALQDHRIFIFQEIQEVREGGNHANKESLAASIDLERAETLLPALTHINTREHAETYKERLKDHTNHPDERFYGYVKWLDGQTKTWGFIHTGEGNPEFYFHITSILCHHPTQYCTVNSPVSFQREPARSAQKTAKAYNIMPLALFHPSIPRCELPPPLRGMVSKIDNGGGRIRLRNTKHVYVQFSSDDINDDSAKDVVLHNGVKFYPKVEGSPETGHTLHAHMITAEKPAQTNASAASQKARGKPVKGRLRIPQATAQAMQHSTTMQIDLEWEQDDTKNSNVFLSSSANARSKLAGNLGKRITELTPNEIVTDAIDRKERTEREILNAADKERIERIKQQGANVLLLPNSFKETELTKRVRYFQQAYTSGTATKLNTVFIITPIQYHATKRTIKLVDSRWFMNWGKNQLHNLAAYLMPQVNERLSLIRSIDGNDSRDPNELQRKYMFLQFNKQAIPLEQERPVIYLDVHLPTELQEIQDHTSDVKFVDKGMHERTLITYLPKQLKGELAEVIKLFEEELDVLTVKPQLFTSFEECEAAQLFAPSARVMSEIKLYLRQHNCPAISLYDFYHNPHAYIIATHKDRRLGIGTIMESLGWEWIPVGDK